MQQVDYAVFPGVRDEALLATVNKVLGHVRRSQLGPREFRDWLKDETLFDKDTTPHVMRLFDILQDASVRLGPWAEQFFATTTEEAARELLYKRLLEENTLLIKYVLEALDTEGGGRLHSDHELHRMLTSYVYPGKHIGLVPFKAWTKWLVVAGRVKLVGIRWGLTDLGKAAVPRLRTIDADEFLEDEKLAQAAAAPATGSLPGATTAAAAGTPLSAPAKAATAPVPPAQAARPPASAAAKQAAADADEEGLDLPPEPEPIDETLAARYEARFEADPAPEAAPAARERPRPAGAAGHPTSGSPIASAAAAKAGAAPGQADLKGSGATQVAAQPSTLHVAAAARDLTAPSVIVREGRLEVACTSAAPDVSEVLTSLREVGRTRGLGGGSLLLAYGLEPRMAQNEAARHLFLAGLLARLHAHPEGAGLAAWLVERVGGLGPIALLLDRPEALHEVVVRWGVSGSDPASMAVRAALLDATLGGRALKAQPDLPTALADAPTSEVLVGQLGQGLLRGAPVTAQLWLVREMVRAGLWTRPSATEIAFVPTRAARLMAYRLRLIDSHFASGAALLIPLARRLCTLLPPASVEAAAFEALAPANHLRFDCVKVTVCQQPCALHPAGDDS